LGDNSANRIFGGLGNDELQGRFGNDTLEGGAGADTLNGGGNRDAVSYAASSAAVSVNFFSGIATGGDAQGDVFFKIDDLIGSGFNDVLVGTFFDNVLEGGAGADTLNGGAGIDTASYASDVSGVTVSLGNATASGGHAVGDQLSNFENLRGGMGDDALSGDEGVNMLWGGAGQDTLTGLGGSDTLEGGAGGDLLQGGSGIDWAAYTDADGAVMVDLGTAGYSGSDATGDVMSSIEALRGSAFDDVLSGDAGDNVIEGGAGGDTLSGGAGNDTLSYEHSDVRVVVDLLNGNTFFGAAEGDIISGFENLSGSRMPDYLLGSSSDNVLSGRNGIDRLEARGGDDTLIGGAQNDNLKGGAGADVFALNVGDGTDLIADWQDGLDQIDLSDFGLSFGMIEASTSDLPIGALLINLGGGDGFQINGFASADFDSGDVIV